MLTFETTGLTEEDGWTLQSVGVVATIPFVWGIGALNAAEPAQNGLFYLRASVNDEIFNVQTDFSGTAASGLDYVPIPTQKQFDASSGDPTMYIPVVVKDDPFLEGGESVIMTIVSGAGYAPGSYAMGGGSDTSLIWIGDNEQPPPPPPKVVSTVWQAINSPLDTNPHLNGGARIFPDKQSPADAVARDIVDVVATVSPTPPAGTIVYFQSYDVDDPNGFVPGQPIEQQIDANDSATASQGSDNRGQIPGNRGTFFPPTINYRASAPTDANGVATAQFQVTRQPGDNFRVAASLSGAELDTIDDNSVPPNSSQIPTFDGAITDMLTVWRRLWVERDVMTGVTANPITVTIIGVTPNVAQAGTGGANDILALSDELIESDDEFEGGVLTIPSFGVNGKYLPIYLNRGSTVNVPANSFTAGERTALAGGVTATLVDDDVIPTGGTMRLPDGGALLQSAFGVAYISPIYVDPGPNSWNSVGTVSFTRKLYDGFSSIGGANRNLTSSAAFWTTLVVGAFENTDPTDGDSDGLAPPGLGIPSPAAPNSGFDWGVSDANTSAIFLETIDDLNRQGQGATGENVVVTHEIGHTVGSGTGHTATGIMVARPTNTEMFFDNETMRKFRSIDIW
jgi:hypothetical protein